MRIIQISDTHFSRQHRQFGVNGAAVRDWLSGQEADLLVNTGDLSMNGAVTADDLEEAIAWHRELGLPFRAVPGNHDVGDMPDLRADQVLNGARLSRYRSVVGPDRWSDDLEGWRLIGLNAMLLGTGHPEEEEQYSWLEEAVSTLSPTALFLHKPLFFHAPAEGPQGYWTVKPHPRQRILEILHGADIRLIASGHLHVGRHAVFAGVSHVWGPSSAFVCGPSQGDEVPGERRIGAVVHDFTTGDVSSRIVYLDEAQDLTIDPHLAEIYPPAGREPALAAAS